MASDARPIKRKYEFEGPTFSSTDELTSFAGWLVEMTAEETGTESTCWVGIKCGLGIDPTTESMPFEEFRGRTDEFPFRDTTLALNFTVVTAETALLVSFTHLFNTDTVHIEGSEESLVEGVKRRIKHEGSERTARAQEAREPHPLPPTKRTRRRLSGRGAEALKAMGRTTGAIIAGAAAIVIAGVILTLVLHIPSP